MNFIGRNLSPKVKILLEGMENPLNLAPEIVVEFKVKYSKVILEKYGFMGRRTRRRESTKEYTAVYSRMLNLKHLEVRLELIFAKDGQLYAMPEYTHLPESLHLCTIAMDGRKDPYGIEKEKEKLALELLNVMKNDGDVVYDISCVLESVPEPEPQPLGLYLGKDLVFVPSWVAANICVRSQGGEDILVTRQEWEDAHKKLGLIPCQSPTPTPVEREEKETGKA